MEYRSFNLSEVNNIRHGGLGMQRNHISVMLLFCFLLHIASAYADDKPVIIKLKDGINYIDLNNDGKKDMVIKAWWENNNAHGYYMYTFFIKNPNTELTKKVVWPDYSVWEKPGPLNNDEAFQLLIVAFQDEKGDLSNSFYSHQGADCVLRDIYLLKNKDGKFSVIAAERTFKESFAEEQKVTFYRYEFIEDNEGLMGYPPFRFDYKDKLTTKKKIL
ncbi:MAG: hypothetical protein HZB82_05365 [Deltaproteobacteria bacterium]|nr:hypothetical protein [Deltaproteobacteria bacterium]